MIPLCHFSKLPWQRIQSKMFQSCLYEMWKLGFDHGPFYFASFVSILKCAYYKVKDFRQARASVVDSSKVTIKKNRREPIWLCSLRDHSYITSAKGLGGVGSKNGNFCWSSGLLYLCWMGGFEKVQKRAKVIYGGS